MRRTAVSELGGTLDAVLTARLTRGRRRSELVVGVAAWVRVESLGGPPRGLDLDHEFWHDSAHQGVAPGHAVSEQPSIVPEIACGAEHGARQFAEAILYEEFAPAANECPNRRSGQPGLQSADPRAPRGF